VRWTKIRCRGRRFLASMRGLSVKRCSVSLLSPRDRARRLRREMTDAERRLWLQLRNRQLAGAKFRRQFPVAGFIVDFCCPERRLVIKVDGGQHAEQRAADGRRTALLARHGYRVLRFWDGEVLTNVEGVLAKIADGLVGDQP
jgi:very-short-patch-repair endonuclease